MKCPACKDSELMKMDRKGIEIVYCPNCRGTWLHRGELDRIIERSDDETHPGEGGQSEEHRFKKKKQSVLGDLFDF